MKDEKLSVYVMDENLMCKRCWLGQMINPKSPRCGRYPEGKPFEVYCLGKPCPKAVRPLDGREYTGDNPFVK